MARMEILSALAARPQFAVKETSAYRIIYWLKTDLNETRATVVDFTRSGQVRSAFGPAIECRTTDSGKLSTIHADITRRGRMLNNHPSPAPSVPATTP